MSTDWVTVDLVHKAFPKTFLYRLKKVEKLLLEKYPTGDVWLNTSISLKEPIKDVITDLQHILTWAWERELFIHSTYSEKIEEYIMSGYFNQLNLTLTNFALNKGLINEELLQKIKDFSPVTYRALRKAVILVSLFSMKPFDKVTDKDVKEKEAMVNQLSYQMFNCPKHLQDFRLHLGYSSKIVKKKPTRKSSWEILRESYPAHADLFNRYHNYLVAGSLSKSVIKARGRAVKMLFQFLSEQDWENCTNFKQEDFLHHTSWLKSHYKNVRVFVGTVSDTKNFLQWGSDIEEDYSFFPKVLEFPHNYWKKISREAKEYYHNSSGHSFEKKGMAEAFIKTLGNYKPINELEELVKDYMVLISSVPCRVDYVRTLPKDCLFYMQNGEDLGVYGITNNIPDKDGNVYGQFPLLDKKGLAVIKRLQQRCLDKGFTKIENPENKKTYVHLFQLKKYPYILSVNAIYSFIDKVVQEMPAEYREYNVTPHKFRTQILTEITILTRDISVAQTAAGHHTSATTKLYLRNDLSKSALLNSIKEGFEKGEYSGKFYLRLIEVLTSEDVTNDVVLKALTTEIKFNDFLKQFGRRRDMGYCLSQDDCANHYKCWGCKHFLMKREEIESAIQTLSTVLINFNSMMRYSNDFTFDNPIAASKEKAITLIIKRICQLGITPEQVMDMVGKYLKGEDLREVFQS